MKAVKVVWRDSMNVGEGAWVSKRQAKRDRKCLIKQVGYVLKDDKVGLVLAGGVVVGGRSVSGKTFIPRGAVVSVRRLK